MAGLTRAQIAAKKAAQASQRPDADANVAANEENKHPAGDGGQPPAAPLPKRISLTCPFGYFDDDGQGHFWSASQQVDDPAEVADLVAHGAEHVVLE